MDARRRLDSERERLTRILVAAFPSASPARITDSVQTLIAFVDAFPPSARRVVRLSSWLHGRRRATRIPAVARIARLCLDLAVIAYYEQPAVRAEVGYEPDPWIAERAAEREARWSPEIAAHGRVVIEPAPLRPRTDSPHRPTGSIVAGSTMDGPLEVDVVVVGSGAGGSVVAAELAEAGLSVAVLEEGDHHRTEDFTTATLDMLRLLYRDAGASSTLSRTPVQFSEGRCVGGSTTVNGAMAFRASERVLRRWADSAGLPRFDLETEYSRVERFLSVAPPDPHSPGRDQHLLRAGAARLGWRTIENQRAQVHCIGCNVCVWGCPTGAKQSTLVSYLPRAVAFGATVWTGCRVDRLLFAGKRATGVTGRLTSTGDPFTVRARRVVLAAGAVQTPALLQRSHIRTPSGQVGRNLTLHPGAAVTALFDEPVQGWRGAHQSYQVREFEDDGVILAAVNLPPSLAARSLGLRGTALEQAMADYPRMLTAGVLVEDTGAGRVRTLGREDVAVTYPVTRRDGDRIVRAVTLLSEALFAAGARRVHLPIDGTSPVDSMDAVRRCTGAVAPHRLELSTVHLMGTARLGADPMASVCDPLGAVRDTDRLLVADASLFPGAVGVNPQLTVMALATRVAGRIIDEW
ncbi:MAG: FAD-dependent oxidoreductase [Jatrophihabitans sp.]|uniref:FAD-dependent oxidoreductase n=1 Tax=Jatrophihabitans sp. TaxID=1932789 RepID=UPI0039116990